MSPQPASTSADSLPVTTKGPTPTGAVGALSKVSSLLLITAGSSGSLVLFYLGRTVFVCDGTSTTSATLPSKDAVRPYLSSTIRRRLAKMGDSGACFLWDTNTSGGAAATISQLTGVSRDGSANISEWAVPHLSTWTPTEADKLVCPPHDKSANLSAALPEMVVSYLSNIPGSHNDLYDAAVAAGRPPQAESAPSKGPHRATIIKGLRPPEAYISATIELLTARK